MCSSVCFFGMNPDKPSLLLQNDFCHFKTLPSSKKDKRYNLQAKLSSFRGLHVRVQKKVLGSSVDENDPHNLVVWCVLKLYNI